MAKIEVLLDPQARVAHIDTLLRLDGLTNIKEDPNAAYCPISLTTVPESIKPLLLSRQALLQKVLSRVGIDCYDPRSSPTSPDKNRELDPPAIYKEDSKQIVGRRFFVGHEVFPSEGKGTEKQVASDYNRIAVLLVDGNFRHTRMQPHRIIYLQYYNFVDQIEDFIKVFQELKNFVPGMGLINGGKDEKTAVLLGFSKSGRKRIVDLEQHIYKKFPRLRFKYDGDKPTLDLEVQNPELFYEKRPRSTIYGIEN